MRHAWVLALMITASCGQGKPADSGAAPAAVTPAAELAAPAAAPTGALDTPAPAAAAAPAEDAPTEPLTAAKLGSPAPDFSLTDTDGTPWKLSDHRGKIVALEWFNPGCPFVKYAYGEGPLKDHASTTMSDAVVWVNINSGAPGKQGNGLAVNREARERWGIRQPVLIDEDGRVGRAYEAKTTPAIFIIDTQGILAYQSALDNAPLGRVDGDEVAVNYVRAALADLAAGRPVAIPDTVSYGCSVKY